MITTTHVILNVTLLGRKSDPKRNWPIILGCVVPDIPMIVYFMLVFYAQFQHFGMDVHYLDEFHLRATWVDWAHSIPVALAGILLGLLIKRKFVTFFFASMALHSLADLPFHGQYAHRHFLPFSSWQFNSPITFTDPQAMAAIMAPIEWLLVALCVAILWRRELTRWVQVLLLFICISQAFWVVYYYWRIYW
jgi:hypothetical protein